MSGKHGRAAGICPHPSGTPGGFLREGHWSQLFEDWLRSQDEHCRQSPGTEVGAKCQERMAGLKSESREWTGFNQNSPTVHAKGFGLYLISKAMAVQWGAGGADGIGLGLQRAWLVAFAV